jgi:hypothetical protein
MLRNPFAEGCLQHPLHHVEKLSIGNLKSLIPLSFANDRDDNSEPHNIGHTVNARHAQSRLPANISCLVGRRSRSDKYVIPTDYEHSGCGVATPRPVARCRRHTCSTQDSVNFWWAKRHTRDSLGVACL